MRNDPTRTTVRARNRPLPICLLADSAAGAWGPCFTHSWSETPYTDMQKIVYSLGFNFVSPRVTAVVLLVGMLYLLLALLV